MKVQKKIHPIFWSNIRLKRLYPYQRFSLIGKYQYIYTLRKGRISLISLPDYFMDKKTLWEIYCINGELFEDIERFDTKSQALKRIKELNNL